MDHSSYGFTRFFDKRGRPWHTDDRHIDTLHELAVASPLNSLLCEIGCWMGASTSAFIEAMKLRKDLRLLLFDIQITSQLLRLVDESGVADRVEIRQHPAYKAMTEAAQLVFIDGDHGWPAVADLAVCLAMGCRVIALHDTNGYNPKVQKACQGSILAAGILKRSPGRKHWEDCRGRKGEQTHRGLLVSWPREEEWVCSVLSSG